MLEKEVKDFFSSHIWFVATAGAQADLVPIALTHIGSDGKFMFADTCLNKTRENLISNGDIVIMAFDEATMTGYAVYGTAIYMQAGDAVRRLEEKASGKGFKLKMHGAAFVFPEKIEKLTPDSFGEATVVW